MVERGAGRMGAVTRCFCGLGFKRKMRKSKTKTSKSTEENSAYDSRRKVGLRVIIPCMLAQMELELSIASCFFPHSNLLFG